MLTYLASHIDQRLMRDGQQRSLSWLLEQMAWTLCRSVSWGHAAESACPSFVAVAELQSQPVLS